MILDLNKRHKYVNSENNLILDLNKRHKYVNSENNLILALNKRHQCVNSENNLILDIHKRHQCVNSENNLILVLNKRHQCVNSENKLILDLNKRHQCVNSENKLILDLNKRHKYVNSENNLILDLSTLSLKHLPLRHYNVQSTTLPASVARIPRDSLKYFETSVPRHIRVAELRKKIRTSTFNKYICNRTLEVRDILKILGAISLFHNIFYLLLDFHV